MGELGGGIGFPEEGSMWTCMTSARQLQKESLAVGACAGVRGIRNPLGSRLSKTKCWQYLSWTTD